MMELVKSRVRFTEQPHGYELDGRRLLGVTGLIHEVLRLGVYPDASDYVRNVCVPRAGEYGKAVHKAIEAYDALGVRWTQFPNSYDGGEWEVGAELDGYLRHRNGFLPVANEYTVSDNERWASNIDNVWQREATGGIWLADTKTNNLSYYPGGEDALKEYLSWQLSVYAELFEAQNPGLKVEGLCCNWLRKGDAAFWVIGRKSAEQVRSLLSTEYDVAEDGTVAYRHPDPVALRGGVACAEPRQMIVPEDFVSLIATVKEQYEEAKARLEQMQGRLREAMERNGIRSWDSGRFRATIAADAVREAFDAKKFKADHPELAAQYTTKKAVKGGFTIKMNND